MIVSSPGAGKTTILKDIAKQISSGIKESNFESLNTGIVDENFVIVGHQAERVEEYITKTYSNAKCVLQSPQLGTGHAVSMVLPYLDNYEGEVVILCGDTPLVTSETLKEFVETHNQKKSDWS